MSNYPYNPAYAVEMQTDAKHGVTVGMAVLAKINLAAVAAASPTKFLAATLMSGAVPTVITVFAAQPDVARQIFVVTGGTTTDVAAGNIVVEGTDAAGQFMTETIAIAADNSLGVSSVSAFKTLTKVTIPKQDGAAATYSIGTSKNIGVPFILNPTSVIAASLGGTREATLPTSTRNSNWRKNFVQLSTALNGTDVELLLAV